MNGRAQSLRIVLVQDKPGAAARLKAQLEGLSHRVVALARNSGDAIHAVGRLKPDLVMIELRLDGIDGIAAARSIFSNHPLPIILLVWHDAAEFVARAREAGVMAFLVLPANASRVAATIDVALERYTQFQAIQQETADLAEALAIRNDFERAKKLLMRCLQIREAEAFRRLWRSKSAGASLRELTGAIVRAERMLKDGRLVIRKHHADLQENLQRMGNLTVLVDRRDRDRREHHSRGPIERRRLNRRERAYPRLP